MSLSIQSLTAAGALGSPITNVFPAPIVALRAPTANDKAPIGTMWVNSATQNYYVLTSVIANVATWATAGNGNGIFATVEVTAGDLTVDAGNISVTLGSVFVEAGNLVVVAGDIGAAQDITTGLGSVRVNAATQGYYLPGGMRIVSGAGAPAGALALVAGDMYIRSDPASAVTRLYIATGPGAWTNVTCAA